MKLMEANKEEIVKDRPSPVASRSRSQESVLKATKGSNENAKGTSKDSASSLKSNKNDEIGETKAERADKTKDELPDNFSVSPSSTLTDITKSSAGKSNAAR